MKKHYIIYPLILFLLTSCAQTSNHPKQTVSMTTLESVVKAQIKSDLIASGANMPDDFNGDMLPSYASVLMTADSFDIPIDANIACLDDAVAIHHIDSSNSDFIMILKAKEGRLSDTEAIATAMRSYQFERRNDYIPDQINKLEANIIKDVGNYVIYITYDDPKAMEDAILRVIK